MNAKEKEKYLESLLDPIDSSKIMNIQTAKTKIGFLLVHSIMKLKY